MLLSLFSPIPIRFGDLELSDRMFEEQLWISVLVLFPFSILLGHLSMRLVAFKLIPLLRNDIWNGIVRLVVADFTMEIFLQRGFQCIPFEEHEGNYRELVVESFGFDCPLYAKPLSLRAAGILFGFRIVAISLGVFLGEGWCPIALTGDINENTKQQLLQGPYETETETQQKETETKQENTTKKEEDDNDDNNDDTKKRIPLEDGTIYLIEKSSASIVTFVGKLVYGLYVSGKDLIMAEIPEVPFLIRMLFYSVTVRVGSNNKNNDKDKKQSSYSTPLFSSAIITTDSDPETIENVRLECMYRIYGMGMTIFQIMIIIGIAIPLAICHKVYTVRNEAAAEAAGNGGGSADTESKTFDDTGFEDEEILEL